MQESREMSAKRITKNFLTDELKKEIFDVKVQKSNILSSCNLFSNQEKFRIYGKARCSFEVTKEKLSSIFVNFRNNKDSWKNTPKTEN